MTITKAEAERLVNAHVQESGLSIWQWLADRINVLFLDQGLSGKPGSISPDTIKHCVLNGRGY